MKAFQLTISSFFLFNALVSASDADLAITEVVPSSDQVEVTNLGTDTVTLDSNYPFCHSFNYSSRIPSGTSFAPGETKVFTVTSLNDTNSDLWLYRPGNFDDAANIISGLNWGDSNQGRTNLASGAGKWDGQSVAAPAAGEALELTNEGIASSTSWSINTTPNLGNFSFPEFWADLSPISSTTSTLSWDGGNPPFQLQSSTDLATGTWQNEGAPTSNRTANITFSDTRRFFRVISDYNEPASVEYQVVFNSTWSNTTHQNFPISAHYSGLVGATHQSSVTFWENGGISTNGIESMAESGSKSALLNEVNAAIIDETAEFSLSGGGLGTSPDSVSYNFMISQDYPLVTLVSMIAPSPDWFVGVNSLPLFQDGQWRDTVTIALYPYDSGTDNATDFMAVNSDTIPQEPIFRITGQPFDDEGQVQPLGTFTFTRLP